MTLTPDALPRLCLLVLSAVVCVYFAVQARRSRRAVWLALATAGFAGHHLAFMVLESQTSEAAYAVASGLTWSGGLLAAWAFIGVALRFSADEITPGGRRLVAASGAVALGAAVYAHLGYGPLFGRVSALSVQAVGGAVTIGLLALTTGVLFLDRRVPGRRRAHRTFLAVIGLSLVIPVIRGLRDADVVSPAVETQAALVMWAVVMMALVTLYVNHDREPTSVMVKVVAFALLSVVTALGVAAEVLFPTVADADGRAVTYAWLVVASGAFVLVALPLFLRVGLTQPLNRLVDGVRRAARGELDVEVPVGTRDEVGRLTEDFNRMTGALRLAETELRRYADTLEDRVGARTAELAASLDELRATQAQLIQKEKLASLGQMTAGIAHEIKNPLNFVTNFADLSVELVAELEDEDDPEEQEAILSDLRGNVARIAEHGRRADAIVRGMMDHARSGGGDSSAVDLDALVAEYAALALHGLRARDPSATVELVQELGGAGVIQAVPGDLGRVLINLLDNAFDAVGRSGRVTVSTSRTDGQAVIDVADEGEGMAEAVREKVFEPFFTTKPTGQGTGLGLSLAYDIVAQGHGGTLSVESAEGKGSTFTISLPVADEPVADAAGGTSASPT